MYKNVYNGDKRAQMGTNVQYTNYTHTNTVYSLYYTRMHNNFTQTNVCMHTR